MTEKAKERIEKELEEKTGTLNLSNCGLERIPEELRKMPWLTRLLNKRV